MTNWRFLSTLNSTIRPDIVFSVGFGGLIRAFLIIGFLVRSSLIGPKSQTQELHRILNPHQARGSPIPELTESPVLVAVE